jgi:hypothetical protein
VCATSFRPNLAASSRGVSPESVEGASTSAFLSSNSVSTDRWPLTAACVVCVGVTVRVGRCGKDRSGGSAGEVLFLLGNFRERYQEI